MDLGFLCMYYIFWNITESCPDGYDLMPNLRICYKVFPTTSATESEAVSSCSSEDARLAVVDTEDKYDFFTTLTQPYNPSKLNVTYYG